MKTFIKLENTYNENQATLLQLKCVKELMLPFKNGNKLFKNAFTINGKIVTCNITKSEVENLISALKVFKEGDEISLNGYDEVVSYNKWKEKYYKKLEAKKPLYYPIVPKIIVNSVKKMTIEDMEKLYEKYENDND